MTKTCDMTLQPEDVTVGIVVGERLNSFKYSDVPGHICLCMDEWHDVLLVVMFFKT